MAFLKVLKFFEREQGLNRDFLKKKIIYQGFLKDFLLIHCINNVKQQRRACRVVHGSSLYNYRPRKDTIVIKPCSQLLLLNFFRYN